MRLEEYLQELSKIKLLEPDREQDLWRAYKDGQDPDARRLLIESYQPLVFKNAMPFRNVDNIMDVVQEGTVGLIEAVESYDYHRGVAFSLFAAHRIRGRMLNFLKKEGTSELPCIDGCQGDSEGLSVKDLIVDTSAAVPEQAETHELVAQLKGALARLPQKERLVLEHVYLQSAEVKDVADLLQVSTSHIYRLQKSGIRRVRGMLSRFMQYW